MCLHSGKLMGELPESCSQLVNFDTHTHTHAKPCCHQDRRISRVYRSPILIDIKSDGSEICLLFLLTCQLPAENILPSPMTSMTSYSVYWWITKPSLQMHTASYCIVVCRCILAYAYLLAIILFCSNLLLIYCLINSK